jgi:hypothetical protein
LEYVAGEGGEDVVGCNMNVRKRNVVYNWNLATDIKGGVQGEHCAPCVERKRDTQTAACKET